MGVAMRDSPTHSFPRTLARMGPETRSCHSSPRASDPAPQCLCNQQRTGLRWNSVALRVMHPSRPKAREGVNRLASAAVSNLDDSPHSLSNTASSPMRGFHLQNPLVRSHPRAGTQPVPRDTRIPPRHLTMLLGTRSPRRRVPQSTADTRLQMCV